MESNKVKITVEYGQNNKEVFEGSGVVLLVSNDNRVAQELRAPSNDVGIPCFGSAILGEFSLTELYMAKQTFVNGIIPYIDKSTESIPEYLKTILDAVSSMTTVVDRKSYSNSDYSNKIDAESTISDEQAQKINDLTKFIHDTIVQATIQASRKNK